MTLNPIETLKTSIYNQKLIKNKKIRFKFSNIYKQIKNPYFPKIEIKINQRFMPICIALFIFYVEGHTA